MRRPTRAEILPITHPRALAVALQVLNSGGLVAFPTDTVYGLGAPAFQPNAVARLYAVKGRPRTKAIPILLNDAGALERVAQDIPPEAWLLAEKFWPGPLTIVLARKPTVPDVVTAGGENLAVRVPNHHFALRLIEAVGGALAATSANPSGRPDPVTAEEVLAYLGGRIELILDGGRCPGGVPSTVVDVTRIPPVVIRRGAISQQEVEEQLVRLP